jgi:outer membrane protein, heavy metal efflux system
MMLSCVAAAGCAAPQRELLAPINAELTRRQLPALEAVSPDQLQVSAALRPLLQRPLTLESALRIALANNRRLQAEASELGVAEADLLTASLPAVEVQATYHLGTFEIDALAEVFSLVDLVGRRRAATAHRRAVDASVLGHALRLAAEAELAFGGVQAALASAALRQQHFDAASAAVLVQERAFEGGGGTELALDRERDQRETARAMLGRAQVELLLARERLGKLLGVSGADTEWSVEPSPPSLPAQAPVLDDLEREAVSASTELAMARATSQERAQRLGVSRLQRWLPGLGVGAVAETVKNGWGYGPAVSLSLPLSGGATAAERRDASQLRRAQHELYAVAVETRSAARTARLSALGAYAEAAHLRDVIVPLRQRILDETVRHYNAMNADTFALLAAQQALVEGQHMLVDATARFGQAMAMVRALRRGVMLATEPSMGAAVPEDTAAPGPPSLHGLH